MTFQYTWLKVLEAAVRARRSLSVEELEGELGKRGFSLGRPALEEAISKLREQGLIEVLVLAGGGTAAMGSIAATPSGERKVRSIIRL